MTTEIAESPSEAVEIAGDMTDQQAFIHRLATDPNVDVDKLERLIAMQERADARAAKMAFTQAFVAMQGELPEVGKRGMSHQGNYALFEDIQRKLRPCLQKHGFVLNYLTELSDGKVQVTAVLSHRDGHSQETSFVTKPDGSGKKNDIQAQGSAMSYAMRYATLALLNITTTGMDDDGNGAGNAPEGAAPDSPPEGYEEWVADMASTADNGIPALQAAWGKSTAAHRLYITENEPDRWESIKVTAQQAPA